MQAGYRRTLLSAACALLLSATAQADEDAVRAGMEAFIGAPVVESVKPAGYGELYEVVLRSGELVYTDAEVGFVIDGRLIDTETRRDVTQERLQSLSAIDFESLPLDNAFKLVRGDGSRVFATFEDPNCGYCKRLAAEIASLDDVTVYTFLYPILNPDSERKSRNIWCADDSAHAWNEWMLNEREPEEASCDSSVIDENVALGRQMRIQGTPTIFLVDGQRLGGYLPADQLDRLLDQVQP